MLKAGIDFIRYFPVRIKKIMELISHPDLSQSYYPEEERKSKSKIFFENLWWLLRYQEVNTTYYLYGFDRKKSDDPKKYLRSKEFWELQKRIRGSRKVDDVSMDYRCIVHDKLLFGHYLKGLGFPTPAIIAVGDKEEITWLENRSTEGLESVLSADRDVFFKDMLGESGIGSYPIKVTGGRLFFKGKERTLSEFKSLITRHFLIQERIRQHEIMDKLSPHSVNTVRLVTVMNNGKPEPFFGFLRFSTKNSGVDNWAAGGILIGIDITTGKLQQYGIYKPGYGTRVNTHPHTHIKFKDFTIPFYDHTLKLCLELHSYFLGIHSIGWDVAITKEGPCIIEANDQWIIDGSQAVHGGLRSRYMEVYPKELLD